MNKVWLESEKQFIRDNSDTMKDIEIAKELTRIIKRNVTLNAVRKQRQNMGLNKKPGRGICGLVKNDNN